MQRSVIVFLVIGLLAVPALPQAMSSSGGSAAEILWDRWGVPHIYAHDTESAFRAFGWAQMQAHANLILHSIARARGRGAEYFGEEQLAADQGARTLNIYGTAQKWRKQQSVEFGRLLEAFTDGVNSYGRQHSDRIDPLARAVLPVDSVDILAHTIAVQYDFTAWDSKCGEVLDDGFPGGSNGWAIGPPHSASGHSMLLINPHLEWGGELMFFEAQIATPEFNMYGSALVGWPALAIGFNDTHGWTGTVNMITPCNVYHLTPDGDGYKFDGAKQAFVADTQSIKVRQHDGSLKNVPFVVRQSIAGPVVEKDGKLLAIRAVGLQGAPYAGELDEWLQMGRAKNLAEFQAALQRQQIPMFTIIYADRDAHIMIVFNGEAPVHTKGTASFWKDPVPAETSDLLWNSIYPYKDLPKAIDPASGWVQNSNCAPWYMTEPFLNPKDYPADIAPGFDERLGRLFTREQRAIRMLTQDQKISFDKLVADKYSTRSETADRLLDDLIAAVQQYGPEHAKQAAEVLRKWDRTADVDSRGGALFQFWIDEMLKYHDFTAVPFDLKRPIDTPRGFKDPKAAAEALAVAADKLEKLAGRLDVPWGDLYRFRRGQFDFPGNGSGNTFGTFRVVDYAPTKDGHFQGYDGDSFIAAVEFGDTVHAKVLMTYGNASDPASPHFGDQLALASKKELRDAWLTREAVEKNLEGRTDFKSDGKIVETQP